MIFFGMAEDQNLINRMVMTIKLNSFGIQKLFDWKFDAHCDCDTNCMHIEHMQIDNHIKTVRI